MFVAGLDPPPTPASATPGSDGATGDALDATSSSNKPSAELGRPRASSKAEADPFALLSQRLRTVLTAKGQSGTIWQPEGREKRKDFHTVLVEKDVRLPPAKVAASATAGQLTNAPLPTARSPLSPYTPTSPLYPDGLIAPIWVRKHTDLVPAVFVMFLRLSEDDDEDYVRGKDEELVKELSAKKKALTERGVKLTVVLIASRDLLDDPSLDPRLSSIRRSSSLDSRASLFVLTPVTPSELADFVRSLQDVLYEPAMEYYSAHSKKVRKKRAKVPPTGPGAGPGKGLAKDGWIVRYEYKAGTFAEIRGELEVARKHYEDCWSELSLMFHSTSTLPPRTKRWAEAKVLADTVAVKVCKLYLYQNATSHALAFFNRHLRKFEDLSRGWGIGEETFEFWSWVARQYRVFGELLEMAVDGGLRIPSAGLPTPLSPASTAQDFINPSTVLQQPGYYFYAAARCSVQRKETFETALAAEADALSSEAASTSGYVGTSPGFANEKEVDHSALIVELFTKAYELLKRNKSGSSKTTLYIAFRIGEAYHAGGQFAMALRFFERIGKMYRKERWDPISDRIRALWLDCAKREGKPEEVIRLLVDEIGAGQASQNDLIDYLTKTKPSADSEGALMLLINNSCPLFEVKVVNWLESTTTDNPVPFQARIATRPGLDLSRLLFESVRIDFTHPDLPSFEISHAESARPTREEAVQHVPLASDVGSAHLRWEAGKTLLVSGSVSSATPLDVRVDLVSLHLDMGEWKVDLVFPVSVADRPPPSTQWISSLSPLTFLDLDRDDTSSTSVLPRPHLLEIKTSHPGSAYLNERYPISLSIINKDSRALAVVLDISIFSGAEEQAPNTVTFKDSSSTSQLSQISLGTLASGETLAAPFTLLAEGLSGSRALDIMLHSRIPAASASTSSPPSPSASPDVSFEDDPLLPPPFETLHSLTIPFSGPMSVAFSSRILPSRRQDSAQLLAAEAFAADAVDLDGQAILSARVDMVGSADIVVEAMELRPGDLRHARKTFCSLDAVKSVGLSAVWCTGSSFALAATFDVLVEDSMSDLDEDDRPLATAVARVSDPGTLAVSWRRKTSDPSSPLSHTLFPLPRFPSLSSTLAASPPHRTLSASLSLSPPVPILLQPFSLLLTLSNASRVSRSAALHLTVDSSDVVAWAGPRQARLPLLLPGQSTTVSLRGAALRAGWIRLPRVRVWEAVPPERDGGGAAGGGGGSEHGREATLVELEITREGDEVGKPRAPVERAEDGSPLGMRVFVRPA